MLNAVTKVAGEHLPRHLRPHGIAIGSAAVFVGMLLALVLGTIFGGAHIGARSLVSLNAVVIDETIPPNSIAAGNSPQLVVKERRRWLYADYFRDEFTPP